VKTNAEIIPVEPDQGNACAGKVRVLTYLSFPVFVNRAVGETTATNKNR
jgi:hypothetical protein